MYSLGWLRQKLKAPVMYGLGQFRQKLKAPAMYGLGRFRQKLKAPGMCDLGRFRQKLKAPGMYGLEGCAELIPQQSCPSHHSARHLPAELPAAQRHQQNRETSLAFTAGLWIQGLKMLRSFTSGSRR